MNTSSLYAQIQPLVRKEARDIAEQVYDEKGTQYGIPQVPYHIHNNIDAPLVPFSSLSEQLLYVYWTIPGVQAATATNYSIFFTAPFSGIILGMTEIHTTAGTDVSAVTLQLEKLTAATAPGSGTSVLNAALDLKSTINTVQSGVLTNATATNQLAVGDRLALKLAGTPTAVANVTVVVTLQF